MGSGDMLERNINSIPTEKTVSGVVAAWRVTRYGTYNHPKTVLRRLLSFALPSRSSPPLPCTKLNVEAVFTVNVYALFFVGNSTLNLGGGGGGNDKQGHKQT